MDPDQLREPNLCGKNACDVVLHFIAPLARLARLGLRTGYRLTSATDSGKGSGRIRTRVHHGATSRVQTAASRGGHCVARSGQCEHEHHSNGNHSAARGNQPRHSPVTSSNKHRRVIGASNSARSAEPTIRPTTPDALCGPRTRFVATRTRRPARPSKAARRALVSCRRILAGDRAPPSVVPIGSGFPRRLPDVHHECQLRRCTRALTLPDERRHGLDRHGKCATVAHSDRQDKSYHFVISK